MGGILADNAEETVENVAWPMKGRRAGQIWPGVARYWSSKGNADEQSDEHLLLRLAHPACLVREVQIQAFKAEFQLVSSCSTGRQSF